MLLARRLKGELNGVVGGTCVGDGSTSTGSFHEGLNMAAVEKLPLVIIVADNQFAYSTPRERQFACESLLSRAAGYGVGGAEVDGTDLMACLSSVKSAVEQARAGAGPQLVVARLLRLCGHGEHDDASYVSKNLRDSTLGRDCMDVARAQLLENHCATETELESWQTDASERVMEAVAIAQKERGPDPYRDDWRATSTPGMQA